MAHFVFLKFCQKNKKVLNYCGLIFYKILRFQELFLAFFQEAQKTEDSFYEIRVELTVQQLEVIGMFRFYQGLWYFIVF